MSNLAANQNFDSLSHLPPAHVAEIRHVLDALSEKSEISFLSARQIKRAISNIKFYGLLSSIKISVDTRLLPVPEKITSGNRCGHNKNSPVLNLSRQISGTKKLPGVLSRAVEKIKNYYYKPSMIPTLNYALERRLGRNYTRQQRSERREAIVLVLMSFISRMNLTTMKVGIPNEKDFINLPRQVFLNDTGLTLSRFKAAVRDMVASGILTNKQISAETKQGWRGRASVRCISKKLFGVLGLGLWLDSSRRSKVKRNSKTSSVVASEKDKARFGLGLSGLINANHKRSQRPTEQSINRDEQYNRVFNKLLVELMLSYQGRGVKRSGTEIRIEAEQIIKRRSAKTA